MVRRHQVDGRPVTEVAARFGVSRQTFYQTAAEFEAHGIPGLVPKRPGPKRAHKCTDAVVDYVERWRAGEDVQPDESLTAAVARRFGVSIHARSLDRAVARRKKNRTRRRPHHSVGSRFPSAVPAVRGRAAGRRHRYRVRSPRLRGGAVDDPRYGGVVEGRLDPLPPVGRAGAGRQR